MARSLSPVSDSALPDGTFNHEFSKTSFRIRSQASGMTQSFVRSGESSAQKVAFVVGSGNHAFGFLIKVRDHIFQSPISYYTKGRFWDVAPGYEIDPHPDFSRPVTVECLSCHSGKPLPVADTLNSYQPAVFESYGISCQRCHGDTAAHLKNPVAGSIINPARLNGAVRDSICEQCHLTGEIRIPNPDKSIVDFKPGQTLEDFYTTYIATQSSGKYIKVVSHSEQLALSECARKSGGRLWCGSCHNPHEKPVQPAAYFRERCLSCHAATLEKSHAAPSRDCVACHMPQLPAKDGGHTAFTNHRIARNPSADTQAAEPNAEPHNVTAWREPDNTLRDRNLALALVADGLQNQSSAEVIRGYRMLNRLEKDFPNDPALLTSIGSVLMRGKQPGEALKYFHKVLVLKPAYAPYHVNAAAALLGINEPGEAVQQLEKALDLDPFLKPAVQLLSQIYREQGETDKADTFLTRYDEIMSISQN